jgi:hypothetical protein
VNVDGAELPVNALRTNRSSDATMDATPESVTIATTNIALADPLGPRLSSKAWKRE